jgi:hypothetical protein
VSQDLNIDLRQQGVRRLLGETVRDDIVAAPKRELVHIAGDADTGLSSTVRMNRGKQEVIVTYKDYVLTVDVYHLPEQTKEPLQVHLICPKCRHQLRITADKKAIEWDGTYLSIEPFQCTWEMPEHDRHTPGLIAGGLTLCKWTAAIDRNIAKDA